MATERLPTSPPSEESLPPPLTAPLSPETPAGKRKEPEEVFAKLKGDKKLLASFAFLRESEVRKVTDDGELFKKIGVIKTIDEAYAFLEKFAVGNNALMKQARKDAKDRLLTAHPKMFYEILTDVVHAVNAIRRADAWIREAEARGNMFKLNIDRKATLIESNEIFPGGVELIAKGQLQILSPLFGHERRQLGLLPAGTKVVSIESNVKILGGVPLVKITLASPMKGHSQAYVPLTKLKVV